MQSLATQYRPESFREVLSQKTVIKILQRQLELKSFVNAYLFCGPSGCGKTTLARIFANKINNNVGHPIEIDGASNNGVDNIKQIIQSAKERSVDSDYKIFIIDEVHMLTIQAWNAFLKCLEEPPKYTIFILCTTDAQKIPNTILNRVMRFNLTKVSTDDIRKRLEYICVKEGATNFTESIDYISKLSDGGCRDAIAMLDKCLGFSNDLSINNVLECLGNFSYDTMFNLTNAMIDFNQENIISTIENIYSDGKDLGLFLDQYINFILDLLKFIVFKDLSTTKIPSTMLNQVNYVVNIDNSNKYYNWLLNQLLEVKFAIKKDTNVKTTMEIMLIHISSGE